MPIGTDDGKLYPDAFEYQKDVLLNPPKTIASPSDTAVGIATDFLKEKKEQFLNLVTLPKRAMVEGITTSEAVPWAVNVAASVGGPSVPFAQEGAAGIFGGKLGAAGTAKFGELAKAQKLETAGMSPNDIWLQTGWYKNPKDGQWRFEISDRNSELNFSSLGQKGLSDKFKVYVPPDAGLTVGDVLKHPELYKTYPELADINIYPIPTKYESEFLGYTGEYQDKPFIAMNPQSPESFRAVLLHELQHLVQKKEGFATGGNPLTALSEELPDLKDAYLSKRRQYLKYFEQVHGLTAEDVRQVSNVVLKNPEDLHPAQKEMIDRLKKNDIYEYFRQIGEGDRLLSEAEGMSSERYKRIVGEVESRNVEQRMNMSEQARRFRSPMSTQEFPFEEQIIPK